MNSSNGNNLIERRFVNLVESQRDANKRHQLLDEFVALGGESAVWYDFLIFILVTDLNRPGLRNADEKTKQKTIMKLLSMSSEAYNIKLNINGVEAINYIWPHSNQIVLIDLNSQINIAYMIYL